MHTIKGLNKYGMIDTPVGEVVCFGEHFGKDFKNLKRHPF
jgi:hypothetical protein